MLLYRINQEAAAKQKAASEPNRPVLTPEEIDVLLKQVEEDTKRRSPGSAGGIDEPNY